MTTQEPKTIQQKINDVIAEQEYNLSLGLTTEENIKLCLSELDRGTGYHPYLDEWNKRQVKPVVFEDTQMPEEPPSDFWQTESIASPTPEKEPPKENDRYKIHWAAEALQPQPPVEWVLKNLLERGTVTAFYGDSGSKKTYSMLDMAVCVSTGKSWIGFDSVKTSVLIIEEETGDKRFRRRLSKVMKGHNAGSDTQVAYISMASFDLRNKKHQEEIKHAIEKTGAGFVVVDALMDVIPGADENGAKDMGPAMHALSVIAISTNAAIALIHHANKQGGYRGSTTIKCLVDNMIKVESRQESPVITFTAEKLRDGDKAKWTAEAHFENNEYMELDKVYLTSSIAIEKAEHYSKSQRYVLKYLHKNENSLLSEIESHADSCSSAAARQAVYSLTDKGLARRSNEGERGKMAQYSLTEPGMKIASSLV